MEVFLRNVPRDLFDDGLRKELKPFMEALGIRYWDCDKPRKRPHASVTFLNEADGIKFLTNHEKHIDTSIIIPPKNFSRNAIPSVGPRYKSIARLHILRTAIYVEKSHRTVDKHTLSHLRREKEESKKPARERVTRDPVVAAALASISYGKMVFEGLRQTLTFASQGSFAIHTVVKFGRLYLSITMEEDRMDMPYRIIQDLVADESSAELTLILNETPRFFTKAYRENLYAKWERVTHVSSWEAHAKYVAHCLVYRIALRREFYPDAIKALKSQDMLTITYQSMPMQVDPEPFKHDYLSCMSAFDGRIQEFKAAGKATLVPFVILFQVQALVWNNYVHPRTGTDLLNAIERIATSTKSRGESLPVTADAMKALFQHTPYPYPGIDASELSVETLIHTVLEKEAELRKQKPQRVKVYGEKLPENQAWVLKALVTPTRILLSGPDAESKNRVLRKYSEHTDYFLRVTFGDEDGQDLAFNPRVFNDRIHVRYKKVLAEGIFIAGRRFSFLGFSHSSLRSHSAWFSAPFVDNSLGLQYYETIIDSLGKFQPIRIPAKCAARIGQAFSETPYAVPIISSGINVRWIPDVKSKDGSRVFSDGVGTISWDAMEVIWDYVPANSGKPTCFQIRFGGVKGMLSLDTRLRGKIICLRSESMRKFEGGAYDELGICDMASKPLRLVLNRQMIKIMEDMGTEDEWFIRQQNKALYMLRGVTATAANTSTFLERQLIGTNVGLPKFIKQLDKLNIDYRSDKFLKSVVEHVVLRELRLLKHKARIPVDQGVTLFGIMDETGFLGEGEVYVTFDEKYDKAHGRVKRSIQDGPVLVTRSPALHPGDIQQVKMVTPPTGHPLLSLKNCIVFSQKGLRDLPSQLSGGDLDGDLYSVIWDRSARPHSVFEPADYPRVNPVPLNRDVTREDMAEFFINFMAADILGVIATRHQIVADIQPLGTEDEVCKMLAGLHSTAVDYSKSGIPVKAHDLPKPPRTRPDFLAPAPPLQLYDVGQISHIGDHEDGDDDDDMGRAKQKFHRSEKILGQLYRGVDESKIWDENIHLPIKSDSHSMWDELLKLLKAFFHDEYSLDLMGYPPNMEAAQNIRAMYEESVIDNMWQFSDNPRGCMTEVEAFCGSILNKTGGQTRRQRDSSIKLKDEMDRVMTWIVKQMRENATSSEERFASSPSNEGDDSDQDSVVGGDQTLDGWLETVSLCWACLLVGCKDISGSGSDHLESFRVVAACCLLKEVGSELSDWVHAKASENHRPEQFGYLDSSGVLFEFCGLAIV